MSSRSRRKKMGIRPWQPEPTCMNCGERGRHFIPPHSGWGGKTGGHFICKAKQDEGGKP